MTATRVLLAAIILVLLAACASSDGTPSPTQSGTPSSTPSGPGTPTSTATATPTAIPEPTPIVEVPNSPPRDWSALVARYLGRTVTPLPTSTLYRDEPVGTEATFKVIDLNDLQMVDVPATLQHVSEQALWYTADDLEVDQEELIATANEFDATIFAQVKSTFAPAATIPGKITILNADIPGLGGYFSSADALSTAAYRHSNERVMMVMNGTVDVASSGYLGTLAHEFQHLVYWHVDPTEDTWVSEGTAEMAATSLGYSALPYRSYFNNHSVSLANWPDEPGQSVPAYAGASLFASYLASRTDLTNIDRLVSEPLDGTEGVNAYLQTTLGQPFDSFFGDWLIANLVEAGTGRYAYENGVPGRVEFRHRLEGPRSLTVESVPQLSGAYVEVEPANGPLTLTFDGALTTPVLPVEARAGESCWWSNRGDAIDSTLTREIDLTTVADATLAFWAWYDIENAFDYGYVAISTNGGATWQPLEGEHTTGENPFGSSLGQGYTGRSDGWVEERIDLGSYAGRSVLLRFEYVTDESINNAGWCIDDIRIPEIDFHDGGEISEDNPSDTNGWTANGFFRVPNTGIPQTYVVRTVQGIGESAIVTDHPLDPNNDATITIDVPTTLVVGALTSHTPQPASFTLNATRP
jgi:hypothetical protein